MNFIFDRAEKTSDFSGSMLGPVDPQPLTLDPIHRIFLLVGKILAIRRVVMPERAGGPSELTIEQLEGVQMATLDQSTDGESGDFDSWDIVWQPMANQTAAQFDTLRTIGPTADLCVRRLVDIESARILGLDPTLPLNDKVQAVIDHMAEAGLSIEAQADGLRDYLMSLLNDGDGIPAAFPTSGSPSFPDAWITPEVVTPVNNIRA